MQDARWILHLASCIPHLDCGSPAPVTLIEMDAAPSPLTCNSEELYTLISNRNPKILRLTLANPVMHEDHVVSLLRNPSITPDIVQEICDRSEWVSRHKVQFAVANCPKTGYALAMRLVPLLYWNELVQLVGNFRLKAQLRRQAERYLRDKLAEMSLGEKTSLARTGPRAAVLLLRTDSDARVITALMRNAAMTEEDVLAMVSQDTTPQEVLAAIATDYKWSLRYAVRLALTRNSNTPLASALSFVSKLRRTDLEALIKAPETQELIRRTAARILEGNY